MDRLGKALPAVLARVSVVTEYHQMLGLGVTDVANVDMWTGLAGMFDRPLELGLVDGKAAVAAVEGG